MNTFYNKYLVDFLKNQPINETCSHLSEKRPNGRFFAPDKLKNHTSEIKKREKETARRKKGGEEKKSNGCTLSFYDGYLGDSFLAEKRLF